MFRTFLNASRLIEQMRQEVVEDVALNNQRAELGGGAPRQAYSDRLSADEALNTVEHIYFAAQADYADKFLNLYDEVNQVSKQLNNIAAAYNPSGFNPIGPNKNEKKSALNAIAHNVGEGSDPNKPGVLGQLGKSARYDADTFNSISDKWNSAATSLTDAQKSNLKQGSGATYKGEKVSKTYEEIMMIYDNAKENVNRGIEATACAKRKLDLVQDLVVGANDLEAAESKINETLHAIPKGRVEVNAILDVIYDEDGNSKFPEFTQGKRTDVSGSNATLGPEHALAFKGFLDKRQAQLRKAVDAIDAVKKGLLAIIDSASPNALKTFQADIVGLTEKIKAMDKAYSSSVGGNSGALYELEKSCLELHTEINKLHVEIGMSLGVEHRNAAEQPSDHSVKHDGPSPN